MKWYGLKTLILKNYSIIQIKKKKNFNSKKYLKWQPSQININPHNMALYVPKEWNFVFLKINNLITQNHLIYFFNFSYFFFFPINLFFSNWIYSKNTNVISISFLYKSNYLRTFWKRFSLIFYSFTKIFFKKLKFKGKGYYIYKNKRNTIALQFNYSHIRRLYIYYTYVKFLSKTSILIFGLNPSTLIFASNFFINIRPINIFTGKGVRFNRQIIYRKTGKVSSYR